MQFSKRSAPHVRRSCLAGHVAAIAVFLLVLAALPATAQAVDRVVNTDCCGTYYWSDCEARTTGAPECSRGSILTGHDSPGWTIPPLRCWTTGCITPSPDDWNICRPDKADGTSVMCKKDVRSCADQAGTAVCGDGNPCSVPNEGSLDFCPKAACQGGAINNTDTDGDGLLDCWETQGIDYDGDNNIDLNLPALGVNPNRRDLLVEIDYFDCTVAGGDCAPAIPATPTTPAVPADAHNHRPLTPAGVMGPIAVVQQAFANAPVTNPDGSTGINLVVTVDEALQHQNQCGVGTPASMGMPAVPGCFGTVKQASFGTAAERMQGPNTINAKRIAFRYSLWSHDQPAPNARSSGLADQGGNFIVSLGTTWLPRSAAQQLLDQAGTFMHEFGHTLGLGHGGGDGVNYKPHYLSVMNYQWQTTGLSRIAAPFPAPAPAPLFDFSRVNAAALDETMLNETAGLAVPGGFNTIFTCANGQPGAGPSSGPINWDCLPAPAMCPGGPPCSATTSMGLTIDVNNDRRCVIGGVNNQIDSPLAGDDVLGGGTVQPGMDGILQTMPLMGSDDLVLGINVVPGPDGILQTRALAGSDDQLLGAVVWDGPDRICQTAVAAMTDDLGSFDQPRTTGTVEPNPLQGNDDWTSLTYDFSGKLVSFNFNGGVTGTELDSETATKIGIMNTIADVSVSQSAEGNADGSLTYRLRMSNASPVAAISPTLNNRLAGNPVVRSCVAPSPAVCRVVGDYVAVSVPSLAAGSSLEAQITVEYASSPAPGTMNQISVVTASTDPNHGNDTAAGCAMPPVFTFVPPAVTISSCGSPNLGQAQAFSLCGGAVTITNDAPVPFALGSTVVTWTATDQFGNTKKATQNVNAIPFTVTKNVYDGSQWWGTITVRNDGPTSSSGYKVQFDVPAGAHCTNDYLPPGAVLSPLTGSGSSARTTSNHCVYTWANGPSIAAGASKTFNYSTDTQSMSSAKNVNANDTSCLCIPETDAQFCSRLAKNCGAVSGTDSCGNARTATSCGTCTSPAVCGGGGAANVCGSCSFSVTQNTYNGSQWWGTISFKNNGPSPSSNYKVEFNVPTGVNCTNDYVPPGAVLSPLTGSGSSARTVSNHCVFTWTNASPLAAGATKTINYSTNSQSFSSATAVMVKDPVCQ